MRDGEGAFAPYYYRYLGYRRQLSARPPFLRANGICGLFTETTPVILKSEWICGNLKALYSEEDPLVLEYAKKTVDIFGERKFHTNKDHFAPNYAHILGNGLPGLVELIDRSCQAHKEDSHKVETLCAMKQTLQGFSRMIENYRWNFFARPRLFGKSLLVSTLESLFSRGTLMFKGLAIEKLWTDKTYKVIHLDFSRIRCRSAEEFDAKASELFMGELRRLRFPMKTLESCSRCVDLQDTAYEAF